VALSLSAAGLDRAGAAQGCEGGVAVESVWVTVGGDEQLRGAVDADAGSLDEFRHGAVNEFADESVKVDYFQVELEPAATEADEGCVHASGWGELAAEGGELQEALDAQVVAQGLVGSDE
jgi:hypothetical protein